MIAIWQTCHFPDTFLVRLKDEHGMTMLEQYKAGASCVTWQHRLRLLQYDKTNVLLCLCIHPCKQGVVYALAQHVVLCDNKYGLLSKAQFTPVQLYPRLLIDMGPSYKRFLVWLLQLI